MSVELVRILSDAVATRLLGAQLARVMRPGGVLLLDGPLGAGKTTLVQGFTAELGAAPAASPSFVLAHRYDGGPFPLWHLDLYRVENASEIEDLDLDLYLPRDGIALVEWANRATVFWPPRSVHVQLEIDGDGRRAIVRSDAPADDTVRALATVAGAA